MSRRPIGREHADESSDSSGYEAMRELLALKRRPDGVFRFNDPAAMGAMQAALEQDVRIPQDLAIVGAGDVRREYLRLQKLKLGQPWVVLIPQCAVLERYGQAHTLVVFMPDCILGRPHIAPLRLPGS